MFFAIVVLFSTLSGVPLAAQAPVADDKALAVSLSRALGSWMERDRAAKGGKFLLYDPDARAVLDLEAIKLDDGDHLHRLADGRFLSWGEFRDAAGRVYMIDFYFKRSADRNRPGNEEDSGERGAGGMNNRRPSPPDWLCRSPH